MRKRVKEQPILGVRITRPQFAELAGVTVRTLVRRLDKDGDDAPQPVPGGGTRAMWLRAEAVAWIRHGRAWRSIGIETEAPVSAY